MQQKTNVALVTETTIGGVKNQILYLVRHLNPQEFVPTVIFPDLPRKGQEAERDFESSLRQLKVEYFKIPMTRSPTLNTDLRSLSALIGMLRTDRFHLVHAHSSKAGFVSRLAAKWNRLKPVLYSPHVFPFQRAGGFSKAIYLGLEKVAGKWCDALIVCSDGQKKAALQAGLADVDRIHVVRHATPYPVLPKRTREEIRTELTTRAEEIVFLTLTRLVPYKGVDLLIRGFAAAAKPKPVWLWIAGEGELRLKLEALVRDLKAESYIRFLGYRTDTVDLLNACDCFVLTSQLEGNPNSILEALAMEKPIIASHVEGTDELLAESPFWKLIPRPSPERIAQEIQNYIENPFRGASVHSLPGEWFDVPGQVKKIEDVYRQELNRIHKIRQ